MKPGAASVRAFERFRLIAIVTPVVFLAAFHAALLLRRVGDASITRPMVLGRWAFAIALLAAALIARRFFSGRRFVIAFWLIVAVLHLAVPAADRSFDVREDAALLVAVLPALIISGSSGSSRNITWSVTSGVAIDPSVFFAWPPATSTADRAPPRF